MGDTRNKHVGISDCIIKPFEIAPEICLICGIKTVK